MSLELLTIVFLLLIIGLFAKFTPTVHASKYEGYVCLDNTEPILFDGAKVEWNNKVYVLDKNTIFLDYRLESALITDNPYAFNNIQDAAKALTHGTAHKPMLLLTAP